MLSGGPQSGGGLVKKCGWQSRRMQKQKAQGSRAQRLTLWAVPGKNWWLAWDLNKGWDSAGKAGERTGDRRRAGASAPGPQGAEALHVMPCCCHAQRRVQGERTRLVQEAGAKPQGLVFSLGLAGQILLHDDDRQGVGEPGLPVSSPDQLSCPPAPWPG